MKRAPRILIKLGGAALSASDAMGLAAQTLRGYHARGHQLIVVHGGGPAINAELLRQNISWTFVDGQRVTSKQMMDVIEATLCGQVNRQLMRHLGRSGLSVISLSGADQRTLLCSQASPSLGVVGQIQAVNAAWLESILALPAMPIPVIAPIGVGAVGDSYNINADWAASHIAVALKVEKLMFVTDQTGIMDEQGEIIPEVDIPRLESMIEAKTVTGGMLTKVRAVIHALKSGVRSVEIMNAKEAVVSVARRHGGTVCSASFPNLHGARIAGQRISSRFLTNQS